MSTIPINCQKRLLSVGLFVSPPAPKSHVMPGFVVVGKPLTVAGNSIPGFKTGYQSIDRKIEFDAPPVCFWYDGEVWIVLSEDYCPGPGPGDFLDTWATADEAVDDIIDFYFGDPSRMQTKAFARKKTITASDLE